MLEDNTELRDALVGAAVLGGVMAALSWGSREPYKVQFIVGAAILGGGVGYLHAKTIKDVKGLFAPKNALTSGFGNAYFG